jgi:adenylate cyclase class IV
MVWRLNRELKAYCPDFQPVRGILQDVGAVFIEVKDQVDSYYNLPADDNPRGTRRFKLRVEPGRGELIYYCEGQETGARTSHFQLWETGDPQLGEILDAALGARAVVRKRRELWRKDNTVFNLDTVEGVGKILEVEVQDREGCEIDSQVAEYHGLLGPFIGRQIAGSNEDLVAGESR